MATSSSKRTTVTVVRSKNTGRFVSTAYARRYPKLVTAQKVTKSVQS